MDGWCDKDEGSSSARWRSARRIAFGVLGTAPYDAECLTPPLEEMVVSYPALLALSAFFGLGWMSSSFADDGAVAVEVEAIGDAGALKLDGGSALCLPGIWAPEGVEGGGTPERWRSIWRKLIRDGGYRHVAYPSARRDRYGCSIADVENDDGLSLAGTLVEAGWALVDPTTAPDNAAIDAMLALEDRARRARRGMWKDGSGWPKSAGDLASKTGARQIVEGRVRRTSENDRYLYLNFGADWRTDFTTRLDRRMMETGGFEAADYDGKKLRVRGVVVESRGPLIDIFHLKQIEFLP